MMILHTVLVVDDEKQNRTLLTELLKDECRVILAKNGAQALERARDQLPDLILLDVLMPDIDGFQVIQMLKNDDRTRDIPVIFISALDSPIDEERGLDLGAVDYIGKPFHPPIARKRVRNHLQSIHHRHLLEKMAMIDALTELPNRRRYDERLDEEWRRCARSGTSLSLAIIDIDDFKACNDRLGHAAGDRILQRIAQTLGNFVRRPGDLVARYGGEEFVLILPDAEAGGAMSLLEDIRAAIEALKISHPLSADRPVTISIGGSTCLPESGRVDPRFFETADNALYEAKNSGKNRVCWRMFQPA